jgi:hypothetical protein
VQTGWIRWVGFVAAPRLVDAGAHARWAVLVGRRLVKRVSGRSGLALRPRLARQR